MIGNKEKCISPWFGFLVIVVVCTLIATAIFFEFKEGTATAKAHRKVHKTHKITHQKAGVKVAFPQPLGDAGAGTGKIVF